MTALWFPVTQRGPALLSPLRLLLEYARPEDSLCPSVGLWNRLSQRPICCLPPTLCHLSHQPTVGGEGGEAASGSARKCHHVDVRAGMVTFWAHYSSRPDSNGCSALRRAETYSLHYGTCSSLLVGITGSCRFCFFILEDWPGGRA